MVNDTPLPVVCFVDAGRDGRSTVFLEAVAADVLASGEAWISTVSLGEVGPALRACITNYRTGPEDIEILMAALRRARERRVPQS